MAGKKRKLQQANRKKQEWKKLGSEEDTIAQTPEEEEPLIDAEKIIQEEIDKIKDFPPQNVLIQTFNRKQFYVYQMTFTFYNNQKYKSVDEKLIILGLLFIDCCKYAL